MKAKSYVLQLFDPDNPKDTIEKMVRDATRQTGRIGTTAAKRGSGFNAGK